MNERDRLQSFSIDFYFIQFHFTALFLSFSFLFVFVLHSQRTRAFECRVRVYSLTALFILFGRKIACVSFPFHEHNENAFVPIFSYVYLVASYQSNRSHRFRVTLIFSNFIFVFISVDAIANLYIHTY